MSSSRWSDLARRRGPSCRRCSSSYGYDDAIVFGHAKDGNLHFVLTQAFQ